MLCTGIQGISAVSGGSIGQRRFVFQVLVLLVGAGVHQQKVHLLNLSSLLNLLLLHRGLFILHTYERPTSIKKICRKYGIQTHFKGNRNIKQLLVKPKDKDPMEKKSGAICLYQCGELTCDEEYIGETSRILGERYKEHLKEPSPHPCTHHPDGSQYYP